MFLVYVAGPFTAATGWDIEQNIRRAEETGMAVALLGAAPLIPHANTRFFVGTMTEAFWYEATTKMLEVCDAVTLVQGWRTSRGTLSEIEHARRRKIPVFQHIEALKAWMEMRR